MHRYNGLITILFIALLTVSPTIWAASYQPIRIDPSRFIFEANPGDEVTGSIRVVNNGSETAELKAILSDWTLDITNNVVIEPASTLDSTLAGWVKFNPRQFTLKPASAQTVRFTIRVPRETTTSEHHGMISFEQEIPYQGGSTGAIAKIEVVTTIYVAVRPIHRLMTITGGDIRTDLETASTDIVLRMKGVGTAHFRGAGSYSITQEGADSPLAQGGFRQLVVLPDVESEFVSKWQGIIPPGTYSLSISIKSDQVDVPPLERSYRFVVEERSGGV